MAGDVRGDPIAYSLLVLLLPNMRKCVCHASLIPRYEWLPAFDDSRRTPNKKEFTNASLTGPPEQQIAQAHVLGRFRGPRLIVSGKNDSHLFTHTSP